METPEKEIHSKQVNFRHSQQSNANVDLISGKECHLNAGCTVKLQQGSGLSTQPSTERHFLTLKGKCLNFTEPSGPNSLHERYIPHHM
jgi:hypothetical protein